MKYPDQCECGGFFAHSSKCPKYKTPEEVHKEWLAEQKTNVKWYPTYTDSANPMTVRVVPRRETFWSKLRELWGVRRQLRCGAYKEYGTGKDGLGCELPRGHEGNHRGDLHVDSSAETSSCDKTTS